MHKGLAAYRATGAQLLVPYFLALLAETQGQATGVSWTLDEALARAEQTGERWFEAELRRRKGEALRALAPERSVGAEDCYHHALTVARGQGARLWELRAATSLARL